MMSTSHSDWVNGRGVHPAPYSSPAEEHSLYQLLMPLLDEVESMLPDWEEEEEWDEDIDEEDVEAEEEELQDNQASSSTYCHSAVIPDCEGGVEGSSFCFLSLTEWLSQIRRSTPLKRSHADVVMKEEEDCQPCKRRRS